MLLLLGEKVNNKVGLDFLWRPLKALPAGRTRSAGTLHLAQSSYLISAAAQAFCLQLVMSLRVTTLRGLDLRDKLTNVRRPRQPRRPRQSRPRPPTALHTWDVFGLDKIAAPRRGPVMTSVLCHQSSLGWTLGHDDKVILSEETQSDTRDESERNYWVRTRLSVCTDASVCLYGRVCLFVRTRLSVCTDASVCLYGRLCLQRRLPVCL